jgi:hypothetical protein
LIQKERARSPSAPDLSLRARAYVMGVGARAWSR